uniref:Uncharacterized protein n=1 Tax=Trypanosoma vivax (strain Y486) TaxID=1055687 RepID=G0TY80_TRYVY|nr:hypothetical protein, unlikely [Trypanosoma vivax Y486]
MGNMLKWSSVIVTKHDLVNAKCHCHEYQRFRVWIDDTNVWNRVPVVQTNYKCTKQRRKQLKMTTAMQYYLPSRIIKAHSICPHGKIRCLTIVCQLDHITQLVSRYKGIR